MMALVDVLDIFPASNPGYDQLLGWLIAVADGVTRAQDSSGGWWLVMDEPYPGMKGNYIESSGRAMFTFSLLKAVRKDYIGEEYIPPAMKAYELMVDRFVATNASMGFLNWEGTVIVGSLDGNASFEVGTVIFWVKRLLKTVVLHIPGNRRERLQGRRAIHLCERRSGNSRELSRNSRAGEARCIP